jgi:hypothetical protein
LVVEADLLCWSCHILRGDDATVAFVHVGGWDNSLRHTENSNQQKNSKFVTPRSRVIRQQKETTDYDGRKRHWEKVIDWRLKNSDVCWKSRRQGTVPLRYQATIVPVRTCNYNNRLPCSHSLYAVSKTGGSIPRYRRCEVVNTIPEVQLLQEENLSSLTQLVRQKTVLALRLGS